MEQKFAWFGSLAPPLGFRQVPEGGACISSFVIARRGKEILLGKVAKTEAWEEKTGMNGDRVESLHSGKKWILPSTHLRFGEHPDDAAKRIMRQQLVIKKYTIDLMGVHSFLDETRLYPGKPHWDLCFLYTAKFAGDVKPPPWFSELRFVDAKRLKAADIDRDQETLLEALDLLRK